MAIDDFQRERTLHPCSVVPARVEPTVETVPVACIRQREGMLPLAPADVWTTFSKASSHICRGPHPIPHGEQQGAVVIGRAEDLAAKVPANAVCNSKGLCSKDAIFSI